MNRPLPRRQRPAAGVTLIEVILVVAVLVLVAAMAAPSLIATMESQKLRKSADLLRAQFARARLRAMKEGRIQMFRFQAGDRGYLIEPWAADEDMVEANEAAVAEFTPLGQAATADDVSTSAPNQLPDGILFFAGETISDTRSLQIDTALMQEQSREQVWSPPIMFYPDGTTSNAQVVLTNGKQQIIEVTLRGLTGMAQVGDLTRMEGALP